MESGQIQGDHIGHPNCQRVNSLWVVCHHQSRIKVLIMPKFAATGRGIILSSTRYRISSKLFRWGRSASRRGTLLNTWRDWMSTSISSRLVVLSSIFRLQASWCHQFFNCICHKKSLPFECFPQLRPLSSFQPAYCHTAQPRMTELLWASRFCLMAAHLVRPCLILIINFINLVINYFCNFM